MNSKLMSQDVLLSYIAKQAGRAPGGALVKPWGAQPSPLHRATMLTAHLPCPCTGRYYATPARA